MNLARVTAEEEPTWGWGTTGTAVPKEDDPGPAEMRRGVILSIKETRMGEVTGFKEEEGPGLAHGAPNAPVPHTPLLFDVPSTASKKR